MKIVMYKSRELALKKESAKVVIAYVMVSEKMYFSFALNGSAPPL
jgi:hypothetical protein